MVNKDGTVEVMSGVKVSKALIDDAVRSTDDLKRGLQVDEDRQHAKAQKILHDHELREDINVSKQVVMAIYDQVNKPEPRRIDIDMLPSGLKRAVVAHLSLNEAKKEYDDAIRDLQSTVSVVT